MHALARIALICALAAAFTVTTPVPEVAAKTKKGKKKKKAGRRICKGKGKERTCRWVAYFQGHTPARASLRAEPLPTPSGDVWLYAVNQREEIKVNIFDGEGELDDSVLAELDRGFRCRRTQEERAVDPRLFVILSIIYDHFGQRRIELVSGFRFQQNEGSRHFHASAMDIRIPGVSAKELYEFAESLDGGGMGIGIYPRDGFVHIDFRAPGAGSYRWRDTGPRNSRSDGKAPSKQWTRRRDKPNS